MSLHADPVIAQFQECLHVLAEAWDAMVWLNTTDIEVNARRREIAAWCHATNRTLAETFGREVTSDEIRVLLMDMPQQLPRHPGSAGRLQLEQLGLEALVLAEKARVAVAMLNLPRQTLKRNSTTSPSCIT